MLTKNAFNALLKTLEEPPPKVVFLFATTELSKIPETILSRCQCFEFKPLSHKQIVKQLELICGQEGIQADGLSLEEIAKTGAGSMRDAQSLLDQVIAYCGKKMESGSVEEVLGIVGKQTLAEFVGHLIKRASASLMASVQEITAEGKDLNFFCRDLAEYLRNILMVKLSDKPEILLDTQVCDLEVLQNQAEAFHVDELQQMFTVLARTESEMKRSSLAQMIFEMSILRLADVRPFQQIDDMIKIINTLEAEAGAEGSSSGNHSGPMAPQATSANMKEAATVTTGSAEPLSRQPSNSNSDWEQVKQEICKRKPMFNMYFSQCRVIAFDESILSLGFEDEITLDQAKDPDNLQLVEATVKSICNRRVSIKLSLNEKANAGTADDSGGNPANNEEKKKIKSYNESRQKTEAEIIQDALDVFGGVVLK